MTDERKKAKKLVKLRLDKLRREFDFVLHTLFNAGMVLESSKTRIEKLVENSPYAWIHDYRKESPRARRTLRMLLLALDEADRRVVLSTPDEKRETATVIPCLPRRARVEMEFLADSAAAPTLDPTR